MISILNLNKLAREIVEKNQYLALSTVGESNNTWTCILAYTYDSNYNFYFVSLPSSQHSANLTKNNNVSFSIYDSTQGFGLGIGLQGIGKAEVLVESELSKVADLYFGRKYPFGNISNTFSEGLKKLIETKTYCFYKLSPSNIWINDPDSETDKRVEVKLAN